MSTSFTPRIALIIGSTRDSRFADKPAAWMLAEMQKRSDLKVELVDLRDYDLPLFNELGGNSWFPTQDPNAQRWQKTLAGFDGYVFVAAEYNRSITGALKNALDQAYVEWGRKPMGALGYGMLGATRAVEHLRQIAIELRMVPVRSGVHIGGADFMKVHPIGENAEMSTIAASLEASAKDMLDDIVFWARAARMA